MAAMLPVPTDPAAPAVLDHQVRVMFELANEVLSDLTLEECLWQIDPSSWTVHERDGRWFGELAEETPNLPTPTLAWTTWHPIWWLRTVIANTRDEPAPPPEQVEWPGPDTALTTLRDLWDDWIRLVKNLDPSDLVSATLTRFPYTDGRPFVYVVGWASMEMTKNISEMCMLRRLHHDLARR